MRRFKARRNKTWERVLEAAEEKRFHLSQVERSPGPLVKQRENLKNHGDILQAHPLLREGSQRAFLTSHNLRILENSTDYVPRAQWVLLAGQGTRAKGLKRGDFGVKAIGQGLLMKRNLHDSS